MIPPRTVAALSLSQLVAWGAGYYAIGVFGPRIADETVWSRGEIHAGLSVALVVMGLVSPAIGRRIDRDGGRAVMVAGFLLLALGLGLAGLVRTPLQWWAAWALIGLAQRMTLYDACFAALVRADPADARRAITTVTLTGGLASTVFWALGDRVADLAGWRGALAVFAGLSAVSALLPLTLPTAAAHPPSRPLRSGDADGHASPPPRRDGPGETALFAILIVASSVLASAFAAHMIPLLAALGLALPAAVTVASLRGVGQSVARAIEFFSVKRLPPLDLAVLAAALLPASLALAPLVGVSMAAAVAFSFAGGAGNGLMTIARGTVPLVLFDPARYGAITGRVAAPAFWLSALAPFAVALALDHGGVGLALALLAIPAIATFVAALALRRRHRDGRRRAP